MLKNGILNKLCYIGDDKGLYCFIFIKSKLLIVLGMMGYVSWISRI